MRASDWVLFAVCAVLLVSGPWMALDEFVRYEQAAGVAGVTGEAPDLDPAFRAVWRSALLICVVVAGVTGTLVAVRVAREPRVRGVSARLVALLLAGMTLLDLAFLADGRYFLDEAPAVRGATIVWLYPAAAVLMGGALVRLTEIERVFGGVRALPPT